MSVPRPVAAAPSPLAELRGDDGAAHPLLFDAASEAGWEELGDAVRRGRYLRWVDAVTDPLRELVRVRHPDASLDDDALERAIGRITGGAPLRRYGTWVLYPWSGVVAHVLPESAFHELRTSRNRHKILASEQARLRRACIGIVGLSVGHVIAVTLALEGIGREFHLADFDRLSLSNMNRVPSGLEGLEVNKAVLAARAMYAIDPYLRIAVHPDGVTEANAEAFFGRPGRMDVLVEECDDLAMKVRLREEARARRIPVICETNDRGLLDVERFDREPERPILHGLLGELHAAALADLSTREKVPFVLRFLGGPAGMSPRMAASLIEIDRTLAGWSQLGSGTTLGGAVVTDAVRRLLLGELTRSGRHRVDLEALISDEGVDPIDALVFGAGAEAPARVEPSPIAPLDPRGGVRHAEVEHIVSQACRAPSGGNAQPWRFRWRQDGALDVHLDRDRAGTLLDFRLGASQLACGAAALNARLAAESLGLRAHLEVMPDPSDPDRVATLRFDRSSEPPAPPALAPFISVRATNRRVTARHPLDTEEARALLAAAESAGGRLVLLEGAGPMERVAEVMGELDRLRFFSPRLHREMMAEVRWSPEEAARTGDGIELASLEGDAADCAAVELLAHRPAIEALRSLGGGQAIVELARDAVGASSALGLLAWPSRERDAYVRGGMAAQNVWLTATSLGLAIQPMSIATFLFARLEVGEGEGFSEAETRTLRGLRARFHAVFPTPSTDTEVLLFRVARAAPPSVRSHRLPVEKVLDLG